MACRLQSPLLKCPLLPRNPLPRSLQLRPRGIGTARNSALKAALDGSQTQTVSQMMSPTGLFGRPELQSPAGLGEAAARARLLSQTLVSQVAMQLDQTQVIKRLDRLSDVLCSVVDTAELLRHVHPDAAWVAAADSAHSSLTRFLNELNTDPRLYGVSV